MTTKRELERKARHVLGPGAAVRIARLQGGRFEALAYSDDDEHRVKRRSRVDACEALDNRLAALDAGGCSWKGDE